MTAFERGNLATAQRELSKCLENLEAFRDVVSPGIEARRLVREARLSARWALDEIDKAVKLSEEAA